MKRQSIMFALFAMSITQSAMGAVDIRRQDPNDVRNVAGMAFHQAKKAGAACPWADKSSRNQVKTVATNSGPGTSRSKQLPTTGNRHRQ